MKKNTFLLPTILAAVLFVALLTGMLVQIFLPAVILPPLNIPNMVLLSLAALLLTHYLGKEQVQLDVWSALMALVTFAALPFAAGFAGLTAVPKLALVGCVTYLAMAWLFGQMQERLSSGPAAKAAPVLSALGLYLAVQCFSGIIL